jgi:hypothetical protein
MNASTLHRKVAAAEPRVNPCGRGASTRCARLADADETLDVRVGAAFGLRCLGPDASADAFLAERLANQDYHEQTVRQLVDRLAAMR